MATEDKIQAPYTQPAQVLEAEPAKRDPLLWAILAAIALVAYLAFFSTPAPPGSASMTTRQIEIDLMYYQRKLTNGGRPHCEMSIEEFRRYHDLQDELLAREAPRQ